MHNYSINNEKLSVFKPTVNVEENNMIKGKLEKGN